MFPFSCSLLVNADTDYNFFSIVRFYSREYIICLFVYFTYVGCRCGTVLVIKEHALALYVHPQTVLIASEAVGASLGEWDWRRRLQFFALLGKTPPKSAFFQFVGGSQPPPRRHAYWQRVLRIACDRTRKNQQVQKKAFSNFLEWVS